MEKRLKTTLLGSLMLLLMACNPIRPNVSPEAPSVSAAVGEAASAAPETVSTIHITSETNTPKITSQEDSNLQNQAETAVLPKETLLLNRITPAFDNYPTGVPGAVVVTPSPEIEALIVLATDLLARKFNAPADAINLFSIQRVEWPDGSMGCRHPGARYPDVITPGYQISLEWERAIYIFHSDMTSQILLCHVQPPHEIYSEP